MDEGVVKFSYSHRRQNLSLGKQARNLINLRNSVFKKGYLAKREDGKASGSISIRSGKSNSFLISGKQTGEVFNFTEKHICLVESFNLEAFSLISKGETKPGSEALIHALLCSLDRNIQCVVHITEPRLVSYTEMNPYPSTVETYGTVELLEQIKLIIKNKAIQNSSGILLMKGHQDGILSFAKKEAEAIQQIEEIEKSILKQSSLTESGDVIS